MRVLITGSSGFAGPHLAAALRAAGHDVTCAGRSGDGDLFLPLKLDDPSSFTALLDRANPELIFHLAAQSFVPASIADPLGTYATNVMGTARLFEAIRLRGTTPRVVVTSSAEVYGKRVAADFPLRETLAAAPANPYAASKLGQEAVALAAWRTWGIPVVITRAFNHLGPGQDERFAVASFARQLARIAGGGEPIMYVGNLESARDFLDVRDVVAAYAALGERGEPGAIYNICSGTPVTLKEVLRMLVTIARVPVEIREDPQRMRPSDVPMSFGDPTKLQQQTGWSPRYTLMQTLRALYEDARERVAAS